MNKNIIILSIFIMLATFFLQNCCSNKISYKIKNKENNFMELRAELKLKDFAEFELLAKRIKLKSGEYLPNSEDFRVEIYDEYSNLIFNSNYKQNYFMAISKVKPEEIGDSYKYSYKWDYKDNFGKKIKKGEYIAKLLIPSEPENYSVFINFRIEN